MGALTFKFNFIEFFIIFISIQQFFNGIATAQITNNLKIYADDFNNSLTREFQNISRCCAKGKKLIQFKSGYYKCEYVYPLFQLEHFIDDTTNGDDEDQRSPHGFPNCSYKIVISDQHKIFQIVKDGSVKVGLHVLSDFVHPVWLSVTNNEYCIDFLQFSKDNNGSDSNTTSHIDFNILFYCEVTDWDSFISYLHIHGIIKILQGSISLLTMTPYLLLWDYQNVSGWTQCSFFLALGLDCAFIGIYNYLYEDQLSLVSAYFCNASATVMRIVEMACYCTWAVGCYDMLRIVWLCNCRMKSSLEYLRLSIYMFIGWGIPIVTVISGIIWETYYNESVEEYIRCPPPITESFQVTAIQMVFFIATTLMFITMLAVIWKHSRDAKLAVKSIKKRYGKGVILFLKLTMLMGFPFLFITVLEITIGENIGNSWILVFLRFILLITVLIAFKMFAFNNRNLKNFKKKYAILQLK